MIYAITWGDGTELFDPRREPGWVAPLGCEIFDPQDGGEQDVTVTHETKGDIVEIKVNRKWVKGDAPMIRFHEHARGFGILRVWEKNIPGPLPPTPGETK
jgi:hypothetical protein